MERDNNRDNQQDQADNWDNGKDVEYLADVEPVDCDRKEDDGGANGGIEQQPPVESIMSARRVEHAIVRYPCEEIVPLQCPMFLR
jgi:hypothetical protein